MWGNKYITLPIHSVSGYLFKAPLTPSSSVMPSFYPLTVCRSDGQLEIILKGGGREPNEPTAAQINDTPKSDGTVDCYRKLEESDEKVLEWRRKLGGMTMRLLGGKAHAGTARDRGAV